MGENRARRLWTRIYAVPPAVYALCIVAVVTWQIAFTLFIGMARNLELAHDGAALDGTAFTLLSALIALWTGFGVWAARVSGRKIFMILALSALCGIAIITGIALVYLSLHDSPFAIPSNVAQLLILVTSALVSIAGSSVGYTPGGGKLPPPPPMDE